MSSIDPLLSWNQPSITIQRDSHLYPSSAYFKGMSLPYEDKLMEFSTIDNEAFEVWYKKLIDMIHKLEGLEAQRIALLTDPDDFSVAYFSDLLIKTSESILNNIITGGNGLPEDIEEAIFTRARRRALTIATREARRIVSDISKRLPYAGQIADLIIESDRNVAQTINDSSLAIAIKQAELAYQNQRDIIKEAIEIEKVKINEFYQRREFLLRAFLEYDKLKIEEYWKFYQFTIEKAIAMLRVMSVDLLKLLASGANQLSFENWMTMSKTMADGQLRIAGLIANMA